MNENSIKIYKILEDKFGVASCELDFKNNYELVVAVILSARCTDKRVNVISKELFRKYPTVYDLAKANLDEVEKLIYSCGFYKNKSKSIVSMAKDIVENHGGEVPSDFDSLVSLAGVGRKTANVVLSVGFKKDAIAVDTHVFRVSNRLGLSHSKTSFECESQLKQAIDKDKWGRFHHYLVLFGRYTCSSRSPKCEVCELNELCKYSKDNRH